MNDALPWAQLIGGGLFALLSLILGELMRRWRSKPDRQKGQAEADRADWELWRDQFGWAKTEITELRKQVESLQKQQADTQANCEEVTGYAHQLVRWIKAMVQVLNNEPNGASIMGKVGVPMPDLEVKVGANTKVAVKQPPQGGA